MGLEYDHFPIVCQYHFSSGKQQNQNCDYGPCKHYCQAWEVVSLPQHTQGTVTHSFFWHMSLTTYVPGQSLGFCLLACFVLFLISVVSQKVISHSIFQFRLGKDSPGVMQAYLWHSRKGHIFFYNIICYWSFGNFTSCSPIPLCPSRFPNTSSFILGALGALVCQAVYPVYPFFLINPTCKCSLQWVLGLVQGLWSLAHHHHWILIKMPLLLMPQSWRFCSYHSTGPGKGHISSYNACVLHTHGGQRTCTQVDTRGRHEVPHSVSCFFEAGSLEPGAHIFSSGWQTAKSISPSVSASHSAGFTYAQRFSQLVTWVLDFL